MTGTLAEKRVLLVGAGGLGCPAAIALVRAGVGVIGVADDDRVDVTNLHRQILFEDDDVGCDKLDAVQRGLERYVPGHQTTLVLHRARALPDNARELVRPYDVVVEGSDNFATKFLVADACALESVSVVHGSAVRWHGTALAVAARGQPCYRCLFEDIPHEHAPNCAEAGVMGPVVGVIAALQADLALRLLFGADLGGELVTFDGRTGTVRRRQVSRRSGCPLCGTARIQAIDVARYVDPACRAAVH